MSNYKDLDLSLFRLNEKAEPLALPWIEQEPHLILKLECEEKEGREFRRGIHRLLNTLQSFRQFYLQPFTPSTHLVGDGALFVGWSAEWDCCGKEMANCDGCNGIHGFIIGFNLCENGQMTRFIDIGESYWEISQSDHCPKAPQTLSHFIDDCNRAGIPLIWTPHAVRLLLGIEEGVDA